MSRLPRSASRSASKVPSKTPSRPLSAREASGTSRSQFVPRAASTAVRPTAPPPRVRGTSSGYGRPSSTSAAAAAPEQCANPICAKPPKKPKVPKPAKQVARNVVERKTRLRESDWWELPPLSVPIRRNEQINKEIERIMAKTKRRHAPEGEDTKAIREILKSMINQEITVHEFVGILSPYTADNGTVLRTVLANELSHFRAMARRVYDTMTQDISDVLINEHVQLTEASKERHMLYTEKMMRAIDEIYEYDPNFNFEKYYSDPEYLHQVFPSQKEVIIDEETEALQLRQEAYHRLMWLRSEGDRLSEENKRLSERLRELKRRQKEQMKKVGEIQKANEEKRRKLEKTQERLEDQLEIMNSSIEKSIVDHERAIREEEDVLPETRKEQWEEQERRASAKRQGQANSESDKHWNVRAAAQIEQSQTAEVLISEVSKVSMASSKPEQSLGAVPKRHKEHVTGKPKYRFTKPTAEEERDPFHYNPAKTQTEGFQSEAAAIPNMETTRVTTVSQQVVEAKRAKSPPRSGRRGSQAPRDQWGGFY